MSRLDTILDLYWSRGKALDFSDSSHIKAKQQIKDLVLDIIEECDPASEVLDKSTAYWGNVLRKKVEEL